MYQFVPDQNDYAAFKVAKMLLSMNKEGTLSQITRETLAGNGLTTRRAPGAVYHRSDLGMEPVAYNVLGYGEEVTVPEEDIALYGSVMNAQRAAAARLRNVLFTDLELRMKTLIFDTSTWTGASLFTDNSSAPWDTAGSDAITHIKNAKQKVKDNTGMNANALILDEVQFNNLVYVNTAIKGLLSGLAVPTPDAIRTVLKNLFELPHIIVCGARYNAAKEGQDASMSSIWGDDYAMVARVAETTDPAEPCVARTIAWRAMGPGTDMKLSIYKEPQTTSQVIKADMYLDEIVCDAAFGHLMQIDA